MKLCQRVVLHSGLRYSRTGGLGKGAEPSCFRAASRAGACTYFVQGGIHFLGSKFTIHTSGVPMRGDSCRSTELRGEFESGYKPRGLQAIPRSHVPTHIARSATARRSPKCIVDPWDIGNSALRRASRLGLVRLMSSECIAIVARCASLIGLRRALSFEGISALPESYWCRAYAQRSKRLI